MGIEELDQRGEVGKRSRQPVYLVDDDDVDLAGADVVQQSLEAIRFWSKLFSWSAIADPSLALA
jgi:hypothetical protein